MSNPDPTATPTPDAPAQAQPAKPPSPNSILNPAILGNVAVLGGLLLAALSVIGIVALALVYDGTYTQAAFELLRDVVLLAVGGSSITGVAHTVLRRNAA